MIVCKSPNDARCSWTNHCGIPHTHTHRVDWKEESTLTTNYYQNNLVMDPNHDYHRTTQAGHRLKTKEERQEHQEETFSDDDGGSS